MHNFKELLIWKEAMKVAKAVYVVSGKFPEVERYGLIAQIRKCAVSIASNIAEGAGRNTDKDFLNFISISNGSCYELETQLLLSVELGFGEQERISEVLASVTTLQKMIYRFQEQLKAKI